VAVTVCVLDAPDAVLWRSLDALARMPREVLADVGTRIHACGAPEWRTPPHLQRRFSSFLDEHAFVVRLEAATPAARARLMSASAPRLGCARRTTQDGRHGWKGLNREIYYVHRAYPHRSVVF
jgi:hypothetical protein